MRISEPKVDKIREEILSFLFRNSPKAMFTAEIAQNIARDEEFIKKLLLDLEQKGFAASVKKNNQGKDYALRIRWRLTSATFQAYQRVSQGNFQYDEREHTFT